MYGRGGPTAAVASQHTRERDTDAVAELCRSVGGWALPLSVRSVMKRPLFPTVAHPGAAPPTTELGRAGGSRAAGWMEHRAAVLG
jgi:hypothetical protein